MQLRQPGVAPQRLQAAGAVQQQALQQRRQQGSFGIGQQHIARLGVVGRALRRVAGAPRPVQRGQGIEDFPLFLIIGQLMFNFFRESTTMAMESVLKNGPLLRKVYIPKYIFPLEKCCFALVNFFFSLVALFIVALLTWSHISIGTVLLAIYPLVMLFIFSLGIGLILSTLYVFVRDIMHIWEVFCTLLVYGSAIFYDPRQMESWMQYVINLNPIYWYITAVRSCVMWGEGLTPNMVLIPFLCAALSLGLGIWVFKKNQDKFVLYM